MAGDPGSRRRAHGGRAPLPSRRAPAWLGNPVPPGSELWHRMHDRARRLRLRDPWRLNVRLAGPRRYGKTSLLLAHAGRLQETGWRSVHVDFSHVTDLADAARRIAGAYARLDAGWVRSHLAGLLSRIGISLAAGPATHRREDRHAGAAHPPAAAVGARRHPDICRARRVPGPPRGALGPRRPDPLPESSNTGMPPPMSMPARSRR